MSISVFTAGMSMSKADEFFTTVGFIAPVKSKMYENYQKLKPFVMDLSEIELRKNCIENCSIVRLMKGHSDDLNVETINMHNS